MATNLAIDDDRIDQARRAGKHETETKAVAVAQRSDVPIFTTDRDFERGSFHRFHDASGSAS